MFPHEISQVCIGLKFVTGNFFGYVGSEWMYVFESRLFGCAYLVDVLTGSRSIAYASKCHGNYLGIAIDLRSNLRSSLGFSPFFGTRRTGRTPAAFSTFLFHCETVLFARRWQRR